MTEYAAPYQIHGGRELGMMLRGEKPLAVFCDAVDLFPDLVLRYLRMFDQHVAAGEFVRDEVIFPPDEERSYPLLTIFYALPDEAWRIAAMKELRHDLHIGGRWTLGHERREGELLGYADWQNDWHINWLKERRRAEERDQS